MIEPQQMLYVTAAAAFYGVVLSTINFVREQQKDKIRIRVKLSSGVVSGNRLFKEPAVFVKMIEAENISAFEVDVNSLGFVFKPDRKMIFPHGFKGVYSLPDSVGAKKSRSYPIHLDKIISGLQKEGKKGKVRLKPYIRSGNRTFYGKSQFFDIDKEIEILKGPP